VSFPALLSVGASALGAAGVPGALGWAAVGGSFAVQTHVSTAPVVGGALAVAVAARLAPRLARSARALARRARRRRADIPPDIPADIPAETPDETRDDTPTPTPTAPTPTPTAPTPTGPVRRPPWRRPEAVVATVLLVAAWAPPLWDQVHGTGNLGSIWRFFTASHPSHAWGDAWRAVAAVFAATLFQHHGAIAESVPALHPVAVTLLFCALAVAAIVIGALRRRATAVWIGVFALVAAGLAVVSVTRVVGPVFRYLVVWMAVLPALPLIAVGAALAPARVRWRPWAAVLAIAVVFPVVLALRSVADVPPAVSLTDHDIQTAYGLVAPVAGPRGATVRIEITDGGRWPAAAGVGLELVRNGHPIRVQPPWTLLFGDNRRATGHEPVTIVVAGVDRRTWPPPTEATMLGRAGPEYLFVRHPAPTGAHAP